MPSWPKAKSLQYLKHVPPIDGVKSLLYVQFHEKGPYLHFVECPHCILDVQKIILDATVFDECTLAFGDQSVEMRGESVGQ